MSVMEWSGSAAGYGRKPMESTVSGVRTVEEQFREGGQLPSYLSRGAKRSLSPAAIGILVGACLGYHGGDRRSIARTLAGGFLGGLIGFSAGMVWETRELSASVGSSVRKNLQLTRDKHWLQRHPIDYA